MKRFTPVIFVLLALIMIVGCTAEPAKSTTMATEQPVVEKNAKETKATKEKVSTNNSSDATDAKATDSKETDKAKVTVKTTAKAQLQAEADNKPTTGPTATLWVTRDFGARAIVGQQVAVGAKATVLDILKANTNVETQYGGGFVSVINGLASGYTGPDKIKRDWFYYMNGIMTSVGAADYLPIPGEVIWWDYHDWGSTFFTPAAIGAYPQPFVGGYQGKNPGTLILTTSGFEQQGEQLAQYLRGIGVKSVEQKPYSEQLLTADNKITVVIGLWSQLVTDGYWQGLQQQRKKTGLFIELTPDYFATLSVQGQQRQRYQSNTGAIVATGSGMGDSTPLWLITGLDQAGLSNAVNILTTSPEKVKQCLGVLVVDNQVVAVPVSK